ncbi:N-acetylmuramoyl-L-alanine amidase family protein [Tumebacillus permanentifrigoris]|uniref:N-acetylmuramoyl-L-alanine amidase n=1 Tax=Tumebacillus permanentifrigoris TaxID=378543 RepID=A0A316D9Z2_9BACL|nr:N-acetylmuramoyl-L-alanine amidase [Tumebacillus permanentifrigoris]PWK14295.1 N-acetylmuramoyl-L-alanine amidase [Tumebacillus permanentifrigoris]
MKRHPIFFHTMRLPRFRRLLLPLILLLVFTTTSYSIVGRHATVPPLPAFVMIDPGHGGYDPGVMAGGIEEKNITLAIAHQLNASLQARGIQTAMTRESDIDYANDGSKGSSSKRSDLDKRIEMTQEQQATMFISLHINNSPLATRGGAEVFYSKQNEGTKELAALVQAELHQVPEMSKRDSKPGTYYLLRKQDIPSLIIECGYLNISEEKARLNTADYQKQLAEAIATGVERWLQTQQ